MEDENIKRGRGRPKKENRMNRQLNVRLTKEESEMLDKMAVADSTSRADVCRKAIEYYLSFYGLKRRG